MSIRLIGLPAEVDAAIERLRDLAEWDGRFHLISVSDPYPCPVRDERVRVYLEVQP